MKFVKTLGIGLFYLLFLTIPFSCKKNEYLPERIIRTNLKSLNTKREYKLYVSLPENHSLSKDYPVIYHLDGDKDFRKIARTANKLIQQNEIPEAIIVGIGYGDNTDESENDYLYTPTEGAPNGGGATAFHHFIISELIPFIKTEYGGRTTNNAIIGNNYGGLFSILSFFLSNKAGTEFNKFVAVSPAINYDNALAFSWESYFSTQWQNINASMSVIVGTNDFSDRIMLGKAFVKKLQSRNYPDLQVDLEIIKNKRTEHIIEDATEKGLKFVFGK